MSKIVAEKLAKKAQEKKITRSFDEVYINIMEGLRFLQKHLEKTDGILVMENNKDKNDDILEKLVHINRITKVVKGVKIGFSALVVVGNQAGRIGIAHAKAKQVPDAIKKPMKWLEEN